MAFSSGNTPRSRSMAYRITSTALMAALLCAVAPVSLPIGPVPVSMATQAIYLAAYILGPRLAAASCLIYLLMGFAGLPVFSGFSGGPGQLLGPTGGYLAGYLPLALISGWFVRRFPGSRLLAGTGMVLGTAALYALGTAWLAFQLSLPLPAALATGVLPFLPGDAAKIFIVLTVGPSIAARLSIPE